MQAWPTTAPDPLGRQQPLPPEQAQHPLAADVHAVLATESGPGTSGGGSSSSNAKPMSGDGAAPEAAKGGAGAPADAQNAAPQQPQQAQAPQQLPNGGAADQRAIVYTGTITYGCPMWTMRR